MRRLLRYFATGLAAIGLIVYIFAALWTHLRVNSQFPSDFGIYLEAGSRALRQINPYDSFEIGLSFVYPPSALLLFSPLAALSPETAGLIWATLNVSAYLCALMITWLSVRPVLEAHDVVWATGILLLYTPALETLAIGQVNFVVLLGLALFVWGLGNRRFRLIGDLGLAVAIALKMTPAVLLALPFGFRDWRRCARILFSLTGIFAISVIFYGISPWLEFLHVLPKLLEGYLDTYNQTITPSLAWLWAKAIPGVPVPQWPGGGISAAVLVIWIGLALFRANQANWLALASLGIVTMTISSSLIWYHHLLFLIIPVIYLTLASGPAQRAWTPAAAWIGFGLIHFNRLIEFGLNLPPFASIIGYLLIYIVSLKEVLVASAPPNLRAADHWRGLRLVLSRASHHRR